MSPIALTIASVTKRIKKDRLLVIFVDTFIRIIVMIVVGMVRMVVAIIVR